MEQKVKLKEMYALSNLIGYGFEPADANKLEDTVYRRGNLIVFPERVLVKRYSNHGYYAVKPYDRDIEDLSRNNMLEVVRK